MTQSSQLPLLADPSCRDLCTQQIADQHAFIAKLQETAAQQDDHCQDQQQQKEEQQHDQQQHEPQAAVQQQEPEEQQQPGVDVHAGGSSPCLSADGFEGLAHAAVEADGTAAGTSAGIDMGAAEAHS